MKLAAGLKEKRRENGERIFGREEVNRKINVGIEKCELNEEEEERSMRKV